MISLSFHIALLIVCFCTTSLTIAAIRSAEDHSTKIYTDAPVVATTSGKLYGLHAVKTQRFDGYRYYGVPYAKPPIGELRFQRPQQLNTSQEDRDATLFAPTCVQMKHLKQLISPLLNVDSDHKISEDCLYLNIYVPKNSANRNKLLPVMVWLPGEGFDFADARQFDGSYLASLGNVVVVTVQYRVGVFGFLHDNKIARGNMGLWDQIEALKWVKKNALAFGGDSESITLFGRFSGSMSISILLTSPLLRNSNQLDLPLFRRAILLSGVAVGKWVFDHNHENRAKQLFKSFGCNSNDTQCIKNVGNNDILKTATFGWRPTFDAELITEEPLTALENGNFATGVTDVMMGTNEAEGSLCLLTHFATKSKYYEKIINNDLSDNDYLEMIEADMRMFLGETFDAQSNNSYQNRILISSIINKHHNTSFRQKYLDFCSSLLITSHMNTFNKFLIKRQQSKLDSSNFTFTNTYSYQLQYRPSFSISPSFIRTAAHGDDVLLAFGLIHGFPSISNKKDEKVSNFMINSFANFAWIGNPNGDKKEPNSSDNRNKWSNYERFIIKVDDSNANEGGEDREAVGVTQLFLFSSTAEVLLTFLTTSTTLLALMATILIGFIVYALNKQRHNTIKKSSLL